MTFRKLYKQTSNGFIIFSTIMCVNCFDVDDEILFDILNNCGKY